MVTEQKIMERTVMSDYVQQTADIAYNLIEMFKADGVVLTEKEKRIHESYQNHRKK